MFNPVLCQRLLTNLWKSIFVLSIYACIFLAHTVIICRLTHAAQFPFCPSPIPPPDLGIIFTWTSKQSTSSQFSFQLMFPNSNSRYEKDMLIIFDISGLYVVQISWMWDSSSLQQNHCFSRYTALPSAAKHGGRLLLKAKHCYILLHTLPRKAKNRKQ